MPWVFVRHVCIPLLPAILYLVAPASFLEQSARADGDAPVAAPKPVIAASDVAAQADALVAAADETKPAESKDAKADDSKASDAKKDEGKGKERRKRPDPEEAFKKMDTNSDGAISKDEFKAAMTKMQERFAKMRGHHRGQGFGKGFAGRRWMGMHGGRGRHRGFGMWGGRGGREQTFAMHGRFGGRRGPGHFGHAGPWGRGRHAMRDRDDDRDRGGDRGPGPGGRRGPGNDRIENLEKQIQELKKMVEQLAKPQSA